MSGEAPRPGGTSAKIHRLGRRTWLSCGLAALLAPGAALNAVAADSDMADARRRFAAAVGVAPDTVTEFQRWAMPASPTLSEVWLGVGQVSGDPQPWLVPVSKAGAPGAAIELPTASRVDLLARVNLQGPPLKIDLTRPAGSPVIDGPAGKAGPGAPALLLGAHHVLGSGEKRLTLALVQLAPTAALLWQEMAHSTKPQGQGVRSFSLAFEAEPGQPWLALSLYQTTVPGAGQQPAMPGPPLRLRFAHRGSAYQRVG